MGFMDKMKDLVGIVDDYDDDYEITQEEINEYKKELGGAAPSAPEPPAAMDTGISRPISYTDVEPPRKFGAAAPMSAPSEPSKKAPTGSINNSSQFRMVVIEPKNIDECRKLIDNLKARKPVIVNLEKVETDLARKMFDFLSGATYALSGNIQRINQNIYLFAPENVNIKALVDRATEAGKPTNGSPW